MSNRDPTTAPQLNRVRDDYVNSELDYSEFEQQVERALEAGPAIGHDDHVATPPTGLDAITSTIAGVFIAPLVWFVSWRTDDGEMSYDWSRHCARMVDEDPDPGDHPAESAGGVQAILWLFPAFAAMGLGWNAAQHGFLGLSFLLAVVGVLAVKAPRPTVEVVDRGLGRHITSGSHMEENS